METAIQVNPKIDASDLFDEISLQLYELDSMTQIVSAEGFENFDTYNDQTKGTYLFSINRKIQLLHEMVRQLYDNHLTEKKQGRLS